MDGAHLVTCLTNQKTCITGPLCTGREGTRRNVSVRRLQCGRQVKDNDEVSAGCVYFEYSWRSAL